MSSIARMPMPMRLMDAVAPDARVRVPWQGSYAKASAGFGGGFGSPFVLAPQMGAEACVTPAANLQSTEITDTKAHGARRPQETST
jgi:hypothetical protein